MSSSEISTSTLSTHEINLRRVTSAVDKPPVILRDVAPEVRDAVVQTLAVLVWLDNLYDDSIKNYRFGTDEKIDVPRPQVPEGHLTGYILDLLGLVEPTTRADQ